jgi:hypothetical protein
VIDSCLALLDAFCFFHKRVPSALVDWTIGQQAFNACMILLLDAIDCESLDHVERVEAAYMIFVDMNQVKMHQLTGLAMSRIGEGLAHVRATHESYKFPVDAAAISPLSAQIPQNNHDRYATNPFEWSMGQKLRAHDFFNECVMGTTGIFLLEDYGLQTSASRPKAVTPMDVASTPMIKVIPCSNQVDTKASSMSHFTCMDRDETQNTV